jgi:hypothetical protein
VKAKKKTRRRMTVIDTKDIQRQRSDFNQILWSSKDYKRFEKMANHELAKLSFESEMTAANARYAFWRRLELNHQRN